MEIKIKKLHKDVKVPIYATASAACFDLFAIEDYIIYVDQVKIIRSGFAVEIPDGWEIQIRPRSGLACKQELIILNSPSTIDSDFRGEILTYIKNIGSKPAVIRAGDRYAQGCLKKVYYVTFKEVDELSKTSRGSGGFGSTDKIVGGEVKNG